MDYLVSLVASEDRCLILIITVSLQLNQGEKRLDAVQHRSWFQMLFLSAAGTSWLLSFCLQAAENSMSSLLLIDTASPPWFWDSLKGFWLVTRNEERECLLKQSLAVRQFFLLCGSSCLCSPKVSFLDFCSQGQNTRLTWAVSSSLIHLPGYP